MGSRFKSWHVIIALLIAGAFTYVQGTALTCGISHIVDSTGEAHDHPLGHDHHHSDGHKPAEDHQDAGKHDDSGKGCCNDFTDAFLSTFGKFHVEKTDCPGKTTVTGISIIQPFSFIPVRLENASTRIKEHFHPPPRVPDIRVFIQSFQV